jgi:nucleoside-diphosphate-sugar epimerase
VSYRTGRGAAQARSNAPIAGARSELGALLAPRAAAARYDGFAFDVSGQQANTLLHDGHAWREFSRTAPAGTRRAMSDAKAGGASLFVHASFAFVNAVERGAVLPEPLRSLASAILEREAAVLAGPVPACVVRLGYLYGPHSADLRAYRRAFALGRPYWSGPPSASQYHLHQADAVSAILAAARVRHAGRTFHATDGHPVPFRKFMDTFAHRVGRPSAWHLPPWLGPLVGWIVREEHRQQAALGMPPGPPGPVVPGWQPKYRDYRLGLDQVIEAWGREDGAGSRTQSRRKHA